MPSTLAGKVCKIMQKRNGVKALDALAEEMRSAIVTLGGERRWNETRQRWLDRAARSAGISYRSAYSFFYAAGQHEPRATTVEKVRQAVLHHTDEVVVATQNEELLARIAKLEAAVAAFSERLGGDHSEGR